MLLPAAMKTIDLQTLATVTGGARTVSGSSKLDDATTQALTKLQSDIKDLAKSGTNNQSQTTQLLTVMMMGKMMRG
jgi:hypothetical protein